MLIDNQKKNGATIFVLELVKVRYYGHNKRRIHTCA